MRIRKTIRKILAVRPGYLSELSRFTRMGRNKERFELKFTDLFPITSDRTKNTGYDKHYIYHSAWAARVLAETRPEVHTDISSILYFSTIVSSFIKINYYDYRPAEVILSNHTSGHADLTKLQFPDNSIPSLSCMHTIEHIGLGRYGDALDYDGDLKAIHELKRVTAPGGTLLFVVPLGATPRIEFNAHRVYSKDQVINYFEGFTLRNFTLISDNPKENGLIDNPSNDVLARQRYGCGCFWFQKNA